MAAMVLAVSGAIWFATVSDRSMRMADLERGCASVGLKGYATGVMTPPMCVAADGTLKAQPARGRPLRP